MLFNIRSLVLSNESLAEFDALRADFHARFLPANPVEADIVDCMVINMWRHDRAAKLARTGAVILNNPKLWNSLQRQMEHADQSLRLNLRTFRTLRKINKKTPAKQSKLQNEPNLAA